MPNVPLLFYHMQPISIRIFLVLLTSFLWQHTQAQEFGINFNHNAEVLDLAYLKKTNTTWIRTTPRVFDYINGKLHIEGDPALQKVIDAGKAGYKVAFGYRWDFKQQKKRTPKPGSAEEKQLFDYAVRMLDQVAPYVSILKLGNEVNLETNQADEVANKSGHIPIVQFTQRLLTEAIEPYYQNHPQLKRPAVYVGSFPALFEKKHQQNPAVVALIRYAHENPAIAGLSVHLHIADTIQIDQALQFVRKLMPEKPIIVPEFSLFRLFNQHLNDLVGDTEAGKSFARTYNCNPNWKLYEWYSHVNTQGVSPTEWKAFFDSRAWYPQHYLRIYYDRYQKYGVQLATYPLFQQSCPKKMTPKSPTWFINPLFCQLSLLKQPDEQFSSNPLCYDDFIHVLADQKLK